VSSNRFPSKEISAKGRPVEEMNKNMRRYDKPIERPWIKELND
jgi:hypothetical protein